MSNFDFLKGFDDTLYKLGNRIEREVNIAPSAVKRRNSLSQSASGPFSRRYAALWARIFVQLTTPSRMEAPCVPGISVIAHRFPMIRRKVTKSARFASVTTGTVPAGVSSQVRLSSSLVMKWERSRDSGSSPFCTMSGYFCCPSSPGARKSCR